MSHTVVDVASLTSANWLAVYKNINQVGWAVISGLLTPHVCDEFIHLETQQALFRKCISLARWGRGRGDCGFLKSPLPPMLDSLRGQLYQCLVPLARSWGSLIDLRGGGDVSSLYPKDYAAFLTQCHQNNQHFPNIAFYRYEEGGYHGLHHDSGETTIFPLQVSFLLSNPDDVQGGEFIISEERPRVQTKIQVVPMLRQGDAVIFATNQRPHLSQGGGHPYLVHVSHGISQVRLGTHCIIDMSFHDMQRF